MQAHLNGVRAQNIQTTSSALLAQSRNRLTHAFLQGNCTHLLFIDSDMVFRADDVLRLLDEDKKVVAAICPRKQIDWQAAAAHARRYPQASAEEVQLASAMHAGHEPLQAGPFDANTPLEVASIGTGIMLIRREAFEHIRRLPGHRTIQAGSDRGIEVFFDTDFVDGQFVSEDISFCRRLRAAGGRIFGAPWFRIGHIGNHEFISDLATLASATA
jgi:GT2 family glycosyltransferase